MHEIPDITRKPFECDSAYEARLISSYIVLRDNYHSLEAALKGFSERFCLNHAATLSGDRLKRSDGSCEMCVLQSQLAEARSQIEAAQNFAAQLESNIKFLNERVDKAEAQLADYGKPVTDEEWEKGSNGPHLMWRYRVNELLASRTQSRPMSERSTGE